MGFGGLGFYRWVAYKIRQAHKKKGLGFGGVEGFGFELYMPLVWTLNPGVLIKPIRFRALGFGASRIQGLGFQMKPCKRMIIGLWVLWFRVLFLRLCGLRGSGFRI